MRFFTTIIAAFFSVSLMACVASKSVSENNPGVKFMNVQELTQSLSGSKSDSPGAITNFFNDGKATVYVKKISETFTGTWKVIDDGHGNGMMILNAGGISKGLVSKDGTYYGTDGSVQKF